MLPDFLVKAVILSEWKHYSRGKNLKLLRLAKKESVPFWFYKPIFYRRKLWIAERFLIRVRFMEISFRHLWWGDPCRTQDFHKGKNSCRAMMRLDPIPLPRL